MEEEKKLTGEEKQYIEALMIQRQKETKSELFAKLKVPNSKKARKKKEQDPGFCELLEKNLEEDTYYASLKNGEYAKCAEFREGLPKWAEERQEKLRKREAEKERQRIAAEQKRIVTEKWENWKESNDVKGLMDKAAGIVAEKIVADIENALKTAKLTIPGYGYRNGPRWGRYGRCSVSDEKELTYNDIGEFAEYLGTDEEGYKEFVHAYDTPDAEYPFGGAVIEEMGHISPEFRQIYRECQHYNGPDIYEELWDDFCEHSGPVLSRICDATDEENVRSLLLGNPRYAEMIKNGERLEKERREAEERIEKDILDAIPESIPELFPAARKISRHFVLHIGPTNSGKTFNALEALKNAESGAYLAPLRLMAYEAYEELTGAGIPCAMVTGEETIMVPDASVTAMTIELASVYERYDVAVIDEAQMISDRNRGGAWTKAILGTAADTVHVCAAPEAEDVITELISMCSDTFEVHRYDRKTELLPWNSGIRFPESIEKGDACIVFSKAKVTACAAELQKRGIRCSVIYGDLPYESRHEEMRKFSAGETDAVISTDAIGMGVNIPVRRVIFLETTKYDGTGTRKLTPSEVRQIAGRAGRFGIYEKGYYGSEGGPKWLEKSIGEQPKPLTKAMLGFPERLTHVRGNLSDVMRKWAGLEIPEPFAKQDLKDMLELAVYCEKLTDDKELIYRLASIPFDHNDEDLYRTYRRLAKAIAKEEPISASDEENKKLMAAGKENIGELEKAYKGADLLYNIFRKFGEGEDLELIAGRKQTISSAITKILAEQALRPKKCKHCGKNLRWNYPYGMCQGCHDSMYMRRNSFWGYGGDWDDEYF